MRTHISFKRFPFLFLTAVLTIFFTVKHAAAQEPRREFRGLSNATSLSVNCDGHWVLANSGSDVQLFHTRTGLQGRKFSSHKANVTALAAHPRKRVAVSGDANGQIYMWNTDDLKVIQTFAMQSDVIKSIRFNKEGSQFVAIVGSGNRIRLFDLVQPKPIGANDDNLLEIEATDLNEVSNQLLTAHDNGTVGVWSAKDSVKRLKTWKAHEGSVMSIQSLRNGHVLTVGNDRTIKIWDANFKNVKNYIMDAAIMSLAVSSDQKRVALALADGKTLVLDIATGLSKFQFDAKEKTKMVVFHPVEPLIITLYTENVARSWLLK
jgi:WD40 repeat protein